MLPAKTCFLIDDDMDDQEIFALALSEIKKGVDCFFANDCLDAIEKLKSDHSFEPDFIFLDLNMPKMNGKQCLEEIRKIDRLQHVPIIIYSTSSDEKFARETKSLGATDYFVKPSSMVELKQKLAQLFSVQ